MKWNKIKSTYGALFRNKGFLLSFASSMLILIISLVANFYAVIYAVDKASNPVTDIILNNIRIFDVDGIFIYGPIAIFLFLIFLLLTRPYRIPFTLKSIGLFVIIRSVFICLTHLGPFPTHVAVTPINIINMFFTSGGDLFFSGHVGLPFLLALIFWNDIYVRILFIISSLIFGAVVLLGHLHYSIDVLSAFFITYAIYHIARFVFKKDKEIFTSGI